MTRSSTQVHIHLLGRFEVTVDGRPVSGDAWRRRHAAALVKLLALSPGRRVHRERVIDALWPDLLVDEAAPRLHKAAHYARTALGSRQAIVLRGETVALFPEADVTTDVGRFDGAAEAARADGSVEAASEAIGCYDGDLLPHDLYEPWTEVTRDRLRLRHLELLRDAQRWEDLVAADPADEEAHFRLMEDHVRGGDRRAALRQFERMDRALRRELGVGPSDAALALRDELLAKSAAIEPPAQSPLAEGLVGRDAELAGFDRLLAAAADGRGATLVVTGAPGVGKSALLESFREAAAARGLCVGEGAAAELEGAWPYAPVLEAVAGLCRRQPHILDELTAAQRDDVERALAGRDLGWTGDGGHQRLFVATVELVRRAAADGGAVLTLDDLHEADDASLRLVHYLARSLRDVPVVLVLAHRTEFVGGPLDGMRGSLLRRSDAVEVDLQPLDRTAVTELVTRVADKPSDALAERIWDVSGGVPFAVVEMATRAAQFGGAEQVGSIVVAGLDPSTRDVLSRVAVLGTTFDTDQFLALANRTESAAFAELDAAIASRVIERTPGGYRFRHQIVRDTLLEELEPHRRRAVHREAASRLAELGGSPAQVAHHLIQAGERAAAVPYSIRAAEIEASLGAFHDALRLLEPVLQHADGDDRFRILALRADLLTAVADGAAMRAYHQALDAAGPERRSLIRARMARAAIMAGDLDTARDALTGLEPDGGPADGPLLFARSMLAYFDGDLDAAAADADAARARLFGGELSSQVLDLVGLQGLIAHHRGEWFQRLLTELRATAGSPSLATALFDSHLCVSEYLLYGVTPYAEVIRLAEGLRDTARQAGALRAVAFATTLIGEAALLSGQLDLAGRELEESLAEHEELGATAGVAVTLQRLAEVRLACGQADEARELLRRALPLARWSMLAFHLIQRIYGTMVRAATDPASARAIVDQAEATFGEDDRCFFCDIMLAVPAAIACADVGDLDDARRHLTQAQVSERLWDGTAWQGALGEARAHLARAEGDPEQAAHLLGEAIHLFELAGQPLDVARCRESLAELRPPPIG